jgi:hypothetical protein
VASGLHTQCSHNRPPPDKAPAIAPAASNINTATLLACPISLSPLDKAVSMQWWRGKNKGPPDGGPLSISVG